MFRFTVENVSFDVAVKETVFGYGSTRVDVWTVLAVIVSLLGIRLRSSVSAVMLAPPADSKVGCRMAVFCRLGQCADFYDMNEKCLQDQVSHLFTH